MDRFFEIARERIRESSFQHSNGHCRIWSGAVKKGTIYGQFRFKDPRYGKYKVKGVHRVALMVSEAVQSLDVPPDMVTSHLCNNSLCVNVQHLVFEAQAINNNRSICFSNKKCYGHGSTEDGVVRPACMIHLNDHEKSYMHQ